MIHPQGGMRGMLPTSEAPGLYAISNWW